MGARRALLRTGRAWLDDERFSGECELQKPLDAVQMSLILYGNGGLYSVQIPYGDI
jgi:catalase (peroxidase I)